MRNNCSTQYIWATSDNSPVIGPQWIGEGDRRHVYKDSISSSLIAGSQERISQAESYVDSDFAGEVDHRRSTTRYVFIIGSTVISLVS